MTAPGEREFEEPLRRYWWEYRPPTRSRPGSPSCPGCPAASVAALRNRARLLRAAADMHRFALASDFKRRRKPTHVGWTFELVIARMDAEIAWCERVAARLEGGAELFPEDFFPREGPVTGTSSRPSRQARTSRHPDALGDATRNNQS